MINCEYTNIKMILNVKLLGDKTVKIKFLRVHPYIHEYYYKKYFNSFDNKYSFHKSSYICLFTPHKFVIPLKNSAYTRLATFVFKDSKDRYNTLLRFNKSLLDFSLSPHFDKINKTYNNNRIKYLNNNWIIY